MTFKPNDKDELNNQVVNDNKLPSASLDNVSVDSHKYEGNTPDNGSADSDYYEDYQPRTTPLKLLPAAGLIGLILLVFIFIHKVADSNDSLLSLQFLVLMPFFFGAWSVYFASYRKPMSSNEVFKLIFWIMLGILIISLPVLKEGIICMVMATPILYLIMLFGGLLMNAFIRRVWRTNALHSTILLPLLVLFVPIAEKPTTYQVTDSILIAATPEEVFQSINHIDNITPQEFYQKSKLLPFMHVPTPKSAITVLEEGKWVRKCEWHKGISFDEPLISQIPNRQLRWQFVFHPDSVPPKALDDHVTINGKHFKLLHGQYDLKPINDNTTELTFNVTYRISTNMNFYTGFWGKWVMNEFVADTLGLYKRRLEAI